MTGGKAGSYRGPVTSFRIAAPKAAACAALAALAASALAVTARPPEDPLLAALGRTARGYLVGSFEGFLALSVLVTAGLLSGAAVLAVRAWLRGARVDWWRYLMVRAWRSALACGLLALGALCLRQAPEPPKPPPAATEAKRPKPAPKPKPSAAPAPPPAAPEASVTPLVLAGGVLLAAAVVLAVLLRRGPAPEPIAPSRQEAVRLAALRRRLELGDRVRDAIIACYADMCQLFDPSRSPGSASLTTREFAALLRTRGAGEPEIQALTAVFEKARYSPEPCGEADRAQALAALRVIAGRHGAQP